MAGSREPQRLGEANMVPHHPPSWGVERFTACWWIWLGKYVLRVGKPWGHPYRYAWRPLLSFFRVLR